METDPTELLVPQDFLRCPIWRYDDRDDLYHPVLQNSDMPEYEKDLCVRAKFISKNGQVVHGYLMDVSDIYAIGLFGSNKVFYANIYLVDLSKEQLKQFFADRPDLEKTEFDDFYPLQYISQTGREEWPDFCGQFEMPKSPTSRFT